MSDCYELTKAFEQAIAASRNRTLTPSGLLVCTGRNADEDSQLPRVAICPYSR